MSNIIRSAIQIPKRLIMQVFAKTDLRAVEGAREVAAALVGKFYVVAPREWDSLHYEVRTLGELAPDEVCDEAFAQVLCYDCIRRIGTEVVERHDLYRICLQDHRILRVAGRGSNSAKLDLEAMLLYVLTHELVHVIRFSQRLQRIDLSPELRSIEELSVEQTTKQILEPLGDRALQQVVAACSAKC
jgi:hypothetical protein